MARHVRTTLIKGVESGKFIKCKMSYRLSPSWSKASKVPKPFKKTGGKVGGLKVSQDGQAEVKAVVGHHITFYPVRREAGKGSRINPPIELTLEEYARRMRKARKLDATRTDGKSKVKTLLKRVAWSFDCKFVGGRVERRVADHDCHCEELISQYLSKLPVPVNTTYLFCRVSTKAQASETSTSLASQAQTLFKAGYVLAQADDVAVRRIKTLSVCSSAYSTISSRLVDIGAASRRGDCILVQSIDRLTRNCEHFRPWASEVHGKGVIVYSVLDRLAYSPSDSTFMAKVMLAENHSRVTSEKVKRSVAYRKARGDAIGGVPYGKKYATVDGRKVLVDHPEEQDVIKLIESERGAGCTQRDIAESLNRDGFLKRGKRWTASMVARLDPVSLAGPCRKAILESKARWTEAKEAAPRSEIVVGGGGGGGWRTGSDVEVVGLRRKVLPAFARRRLDLSQRIEPEERARPITEAEQQSILNFLCAPRDGHY